MRLSSLSVLWNGQNYDYHGGFSTGKMALSHCKHWRIWRLTGSGAELDAIKADGVGVEVGVHQRQRRIRICGDWRIQIPVNSNPENEKAATFQSATAVALNTV